MLQGVGEFRDHPSRSVEVEVRVGAQQALDVGVISRAIGHRLQNQQVLGTGHADHHGANVEESGRLHEIVFEWPGAARHVQGHAVVVRQQEDARPTRESEGIIDARADAEVGGRREQSGPVRIVDPDDGIDVLGRDGDPPCARRPGAGTANGGDRPATGLALRARPPR